MAQSTKQGALQLWFHKNAHLMVVYLRLQLLDVVGGDRPVLDDAMRLLYEPLEVLDFLFVLLILHHSFLGKRKKHRPEAPLKVIEGTVMKCEIDY